MECIIFYYTYNYSVILQSRIVDALLIYNFAVFAPGIQNSHERGTFAGIIFSFIAVAS